MGDIIMKVILSYGILRESNGVIRRYITETITLLKSDNIHTDTRIPFHDATNYCILRAATFTNTWQRTQSRWLAKDKKSHGLISRDDNRIITHIRRLFDTLIMMSGLTGDTTFIIIVLSAALVIYARRSLVTSYVDTCRRYYTLS